MSKLPTSRIDRLLGSMGYGTRGDIARIARMGRVTLDGVKLRDATARVTITPDFTARMMVDGQPLDPLEGMVILMHKPLDMTCSHQEQGKLVYDLLPERWRNRTPAISSVGRLDKQTSGLLLLTDDGALLHRVISPKARVEKTYRATLARPLSGDEGAIFAAGTLMLDGEKTPLLPATLEVISDTEARLTVVEGRYHQVRRMFAAVGNHVETLHRSRLGGLTLADDMAPGDWTVLDQDAVAKIFETV